jgi:predicted O-methyltransferase YrrM
VSPSVRGGYLQRCETPSDIREYLPLLYGYARVFERVRVLEIGTRKGNSTLAFLAAAQVVGGHVWSVDIDPAITTWDDGMAPYVDCPEWTLTCGDSLEPDVAAAQPPQVDVLFNDSGHEYELTLREIRLYMPRVVPGGVALFHDTRLEYDNWGVKRALNVYCAQHGHTWADLPGRYGMAVIHVSADA